MDFVPSKCTHTTCNHITRINMSDLLVRKAHTHTHTQTELRTDVTVIHQRLH